MIDLSLSTRYRDKEQRETEEILLPIAASEEGRQVDSEKADSKLGIWETVRMLEDFKRTIRLDSRRRHI